MSIIVGTTRWNYFVTRPLGSCFEGGNLICKRGGVAWIAAPSSTQAFTTGGSVQAACNAQASIPCGDWFVPTVSQLQNPGYVCRAFWGNPTGCYYSSTVCPYPTGGFACYMVNMTTGAVGPYFPIGSTGSYASRAFRCVTY